MGFFYWESELHQSPSDFLCCDTDRLVDLKYPGQVFDVSVGTKLPTVSRAGLVGSDDIPWFLLANAFMTPGHTHTYTKKKFHCKFHRCACVLMNTLYTQTHARCLAGLSPLRSLHVWVCPAKRGWSELWWILYITFVNRFYLLAGCSWQVDPMQLELVWG